MRRMRSEDASSQTHSKREGVQFVSDYLLDIKRMVQASRVNLQQVICNAYGPARHDVNVAGTLVESSVCTEEGQVTYWATAPPGPKTDVLLIPGLGCPWFLMAPLAVATGHKCLIFALPGTSGTDLPSSGYTLEGVRRMMQQACERLGVFPTTLIGHSLGAIVASSLLSDPSFQVARVLLLCPPGETLHQLLRNGGVDVPLGARLQAALGLLGMVTSTRMPSWLTHLVLTSAPRYNPVLRYCFADAARLSERDLRRLARKWRQDRFSRH
jgi:pimeloyl-ACP methyl ester carboxylesterase